MVGMKKVEIDWREIVADSWDFQLMIGGSSNLQQKTAGRVVVEVRWLKSENWMRHSMGLDSSGYWQATDNYNLNCSSVRVDKEVVEVDWTKPGETDKTMVTDWQELAFGSSKIVMGQDSSDHSMTIDNSIFQLAVDK